MPQFTIRVSVAGDLCSEGVASAPTVWRALSDAVADTGYELSRRLIQSVHPDGWFRHAWDDGTLIEARALVQ